MRCMYTYIGVVVGEWCSQWKRLRNNITHITLPKDRLLDTCIDICTGEDNKIAETLSEPGEQRYIRT